MRIHVFEARPRAARLPGGPARAPAVAAGPGWPLSPVAIREEGVKIGDVPPPRSKFAFLPLPRYSMIALSPPVEPLRMANKLTGESVYDWSIVSLDGQPTPASHGLQLAPTVSLEP